VDESDNRIFSIESKELVTVVDKVLDEYENSIGLSYTKIHDEAEQYLTYTHEQINKMDSYACDTAAATLNQLAYHIQKNINKEVARVNWCEAKVKQTLANVLHKYPGYSYEERKNAAAKDNEYTTKLENIRIYAAARADRLNSLSYSVNSLAKTFSSMAQNRKKYHG
jgi:hypothetical protein